jgi:hypothetical protein
VTDPGISRRTLLASVAVAVAAVVGLSILVGYLGPKPGFQWELASVFGTALGTTLLAAATGALAYSTWSDVRATWELARLTARDQAERERPVVLLLDTSYIPEPGAENERGRLNVILRNVGLGPALRTQVWVTYEGEAPSPSTSPRTLQWW